MKKQIGLIAAIAGVVAVGVTAYVKIKASKNEDSSNVIEMNLEKGPYEVK